MKSHPISIAMIYGMLYRSVWLAHVSPFDPFCSASYQNWSITIIIGILLIIALRSVLDTWGIVHPLLIVWGCHYLLGQGSNFYWIIQHYPTLSNIIQHYPTPFCGYHLGVSPPWISPA